MSTAEEQGLGGVGIRVGKKKPQKSRDTVNHQDNRENGKTEDVC